jgi:peptidoglycan/xylan/chitin deacetylase (PgdA/CDA1 family)
MPHALIYHDVVDEPDDAGFPGPLAARYKLSRARFEEHLDAIAATGIEVGLWGRDQPARSVLTFDDGGGSALHCAAALERREWRGHFFITTARIDTPGFLTASEVRELAERGHDVGSHSHTHPTYMGRLGRAELDEEWRHSRSLLAEILGEPPASASVPGGFYSPEVARAAAAAGYGLLMTSEPHSRPAIVDGLTVLGRYSVWSTTPPSTAAALASGARGARARLWVEWNAKQRAKRLSPALYERARRPRARVG